MLPDHYIQKISWKHLLGRYVFVYALVGILVIISKTLLEQFVDVNFFESILSVLQVILPAIDAGNNLYKKRQLCPSNLELWKLSAIFTLLIIAIDYGAYAVTHYYYKALFPSLEGTERFLYKDAKFLIIAVTRFVFTAVVNLLITHVALSYGNKRAALKQQERTKDIF